MQAGDLRNQVEFYRMETRQNEIGQDKRMPVFYKKVWANILPSNGTQQKVTGDVKETRVTHKVTVRRGLEMENDMHMKYTGQKYRVKYWQPVYNNNGFIEVMVEMEQNV